MMALGNTFAIICPDVIEDKNERKNVLNHLKEDKKEIITISNEQVDYFVGNMLQVKGKDSTYLVMSKTAYNALTPQQITTIEKHTKILYSDLSTIEICGGGSARCMLAEIFLPKIDIP